MPVDVPWRTLAEYLAHAERTASRRTSRRTSARRRCACYAVGQDDRPATAAELDVMRGLVRDEMSAGALGIGSSLIYPPAFFASTEELIELCTAAAPYGGKYISHMRDEGARARRGGRGADADQPRGRRAGGDLSPEGRPGETNWHKIDRVIEMVERRARGRRAASAPTCTRTRRARPGSRTRSRRGSTTAGRRSCSSGWQTGRARRRSATPSSTPTDGWENLYRAARRRRGRAHPRRAQGGEPRLPGEDAGADRGDAEGEGSDRCADGSRRCATDRASTRRTS